MTDLDTVQPSGTTTSDHPSENLYKSPREALEAVGTYYTNLSGRLTDASLQMCYALIGANWVIFGSVGGIEHNRCAELSMLSVMLTLGLNIVGTWTMTESMLRRSNYGEKNRQAWKEEYEEYRKKRNEFPFTKFQDRWGFWTRQIKAIFPLLGAIFLISGAIESRGH